MSKSAQKTQNHKQVAFLFDEDGPTDSQALGGKGASLVELVNLGVPVPAGFTVTTSVARAYAQHNKVPKRLAFHLDEKMKRLEKVTGQRFGNPVRPLLVSVRSGAAVSMPGMLDTVLNLGMNVEIARALAASCDARFAWDSYRRFLSMFGDVVLGLGRGDFDALRKAEAERLDVDVEELSADSLEKLCFQYRDLIAEKSGPMPDGVREQLNAAVEAVLRSWNNPRAVEYRRIHHIDNGLGTAVNVQSMVFGNRDEQSCSGVVFSRNCTTGEAGLWGEFLVRSQGEDVVAGIRTPSPISAMKAWNEELYNQLVTIVEMLDCKRNAPVDVEFTVESGKLFILQVRNAKLTAEAAATTAVRFFWEKRISKAQARARVTTEQVEKLRLNGFRKEALDEAVADGLSCRVVGRGLPASAGAAVGAIVKSSEEAVAAAARGEKVVLVRPDTSPDDLPGMEAAVAIVTGLGGFSSHAAVVARGLGKPAVVGCSGIVEKLGAGDIISVDGGSGVVVLGELPMDEAVNKKEINIFLKWVAQEEAKRWPAPRLNFTYFGEVELAERMVADFYISDALALSAKGTALESDAMLLRTRVHTAVAERMAMYLIVAVGGEMRHVNAHDSYVCEKEVDELLTIFKVERTGSVEHRSRAQERTNSFLKGVGLAEHIRFAELCEIVFRKGRWSSSYGGPKWAKIAEAAYHFLSGQKSHSVFADHAFDLQHNGGTVFGKHKMITLARHRVHELLELKKYAGNVDELYRTLSMALAGVANPISAEVSKLYERGRELSLWGSAPKPVAGGFADFGVRRQIEHTKDFIVSEHGSGFKPTASEPDSYKLMGYPKGYVGHNHEQTVDSVALHEIAHAAGFNQPGYIGYDSSKPKSSGQSSGQLPGLTPKQAAKVEALYKQLVGGLDSDLAKAGSKGAAGHKPYSDKYHNAYFNPEHGIVGSHNHNVSKPSLWPGHVLAGDFNEHVSDWPIPAHLDVTQHESPFAHGAMESVSTIDVQHDFMHHEHGHLPVPKPNSDHIFEMVLNTDPNPDHIFEMILNSSPGPGPSIDPGSLVCSPSGTGKSNLAKLLADHVLGHVNASDKLGGKKQPAGNSAGGKKNTAGNGGGVSGMGGMDF
jgi:phosphohistidine swiveling domain-containing protein